MLTILFTSRRICNLTKLYFLLASLARRKKKLTYNNIEYSPFTVLLAFPRARGKNKILKRKCCVFIHRRSGYKRNVTYYNYTYVCICENVRVTFPPSSSSHIWGKSVRNSSKKKKDRVGLWRACACVCQNHRKMCAANETASSLVLQGKIFRRR